MASPTQWTWVWVNSRSWWRTRRLGVLQSMGSQRVRHDWATELTDKSNLGKWACEDLRTLKYLLAELRSLKKAMMEDFFWLVNLIRIILRLPTNSYSLCPIWASRWQTWEFLYYCSYWGSVSIEWTIYVSILHYTIYVAFPGGSDGKASAYNAGDPGLIPGLGRSGQGNGNPLQYCLENPMDGATW